MENDEDVTDEEVDLVLNALVKMSRDYGKGKTKKKARKKKK